MNVAISKRDLLLYIRWVPCFFRSHIRRLFQLRQAVVAKKIKAGTVHVKITGRIVVTVLARLVVHMKNLGNILNQAVHVLFLVLLLIIHVRLVHLCNEHGEIYVGEQ